MRKLSIVFCICLVFACSGAVVPGTWTPNVYSASAMVASMHNNYGPKAAHGHCIDQVRLTMLINQVLEDILDTGGVVETFKVRYSWQGTMLDGPAVVAVVRKPGGNVHVFVDQTSVNPAIIRLEEVESCE